MKPPVRGWIHVVDLDAARTGVGENLGVVEAICAAVECKVQVGGGVRSVADAGDRLAAGAARVVVGTAAVERPRAGRRALPVASPPGRGRARRARARASRCAGGSRPAGSTCSISRRASRGRVLSALVVTEIGRDGMFTGPDVDGLTEVLRSTDVPVIASGGVGGLDDLRRAALDHGRRPQPGRRDRRPRALRGPARHRGGDRRVLATRVIPCLDVDAGPRRQGRAVRRDPRRGRSRRARRPLRRRGRRRARVPRHHRVVRRRATRCDRSSSGSPTRCSSRSPSAAASAPSTTCARSCAPGPTRCR